LKDATLSNKDHPLKLGTASCKAPTGRSRERGKADASRLRMSFNLPYGKFRPSDKVTTTNPYWAGLTRRHFGVRSDPVSQSALVEVVLVMEHDGRRVIDLLDKVERGRGPIVIKPRSSFCKSLLKSLGAK